MRKPNGYYSSDRVRNIALQYNTRHEFQVYDNSAYQAARRMNILDNVCRHMKPAGKPTGYWNCIERCREAAAKYKNRTDFFQGQAGAFMAAKRLGFLDEICAHMEELKKPTNYWTRERVEAVYAQFDSVKEFRKAHRGAYAAACNHGWWFDIRYGKKGTA